MKKLIFIAALILIVLLAFTSCSNNNDSDNTDTPAHTHSYSKWEVTLRPTCEENGTKVRYCSCGKKQSEIVLSLGHNYENGKCTVCDDTLKPSEGLEFTSNNDGTCYVSGIGTCTDTDIAIPTEYNGMRVTEVGSSAFENYSRLTSIKIPDSVTEVGDHAFYNCSRLTSITIPDSVTEVGNWAFYWCRSLTSVTIGDSVTEIGAWAFENCVSLTIVTIPDSVTTIGWGAFGGCSGLTSIKIPNSVTTIGDDAFLCCSRLTSINYNGTKAQWNTISKGSDWNIYTGNYTIHCTDGNITE